MWSNFPTLPSSEEFGEELLNHIPVLWGDFALFFGYPASVDVNLGDRHHFRFLGNFATDEKSSKESETPDQFFF